MCGDNIVCRMKFFGRICIAIVGFLAVAAYLIWVHDRSMANGHNGRAVLSKINISAAISRLDTIIGDEKHFYDSKSGNDYSLAVKPLHKPAVHKHHVRDESKVDIKTADLLASLAKHSIPNVDHKTDNHSFTEEFVPELPLKVIVVPHSHNDPGWHKTVEGYYQEQTRPILTYMLEKLQLFPKMTFIWAESVFFSMWWNELDSQKKQAVLKLIDRGQLEIVGGGWVVPDEANTHYFALIDQFIEGHLWLKENLNYRPLNTWSLDPFGYSAFLPYLYHQAQFQNAVILRVHDKVKELLQKRKALEFIWRQTWDAKNVTDTQTLLMPYMLYNIKHSCGPDPAVCVRFDFRKIRGEVSESRAEAIHSGNVEYFSNLLLGQYRKKAKLFRHNVVLIPLGDDFRYDREIEWEQQYKNYMQLFEYMNSRKDWNVHARFGTIKDYFTEVRLAERKMGNVRPLPVLSGDFFPYTDHSDEYWTGYFTTRPYVKGLSREVEVFLRSAEILNTFANNLRLQVSYAANASYHLLQLARRNLALFQHHDGITGTSRTWVMQDYEKKLNKALFSSRDVIRLSVGSIISQKETAEAVKVLEPLSVRMMSPGEHVILTTADGTRLLVFNSNGHRRQECIHLSVNQQFIKVTDSAQKPIVSQISPVWDDSSNVITEGLYMLSFIADLPPLALSSFVVSVVQPSDPWASVPANVTSFNTTASLSVLRQFISVENQHLQVRFSRRNGMLESMQAIGSKHRMRVTLRFMFYTSRRSGAYIFAPMGAAMEYVHRNSSAFQVIKGPIFTAVRVKLPFVTHTARIIHCDCPLGAAVELSNIVDLTEFEEKELILRLNTDIHNAATFYTDQNGFHTVKRSRFSGFPNEANYYPATSVVYIEDSNSRLSVIMSQPFGTGSQLDGSVEVMLDRHVQYDDNRGLGEGVTDNQPVFSRFLLLLEQASSLAVSGNDSRYLSVPSLLVNTLTDYLRYQPIVIISSSDASSVHPRFEALKSALACDLVLVNFRTLSNNSTGAALLLHQRVHGLEYSFDSAIDVPDCAESDHSISLHETFSGIRVRRVYETSLTLMHVKNKYKKGESFSLDPMHVYCFKMDFFKAN